MSNQYLSFDVTKQSAPQQLITGRQGDSQLKFVTMLFWDGDKNVPYDLTGKQVAFEALKPDNTHIVDYEGITILDAPAGLVRYSFNEQAFSVAGTMQQAFFKITHTDSDNNVIADSTLEVAINILENRVEFGINSTDYLSEYDDLIEKVKKKFDDYATTVQDSIDKAQSLHDQIVEYTNLINSSAVITRAEFGEVSSIKQLVGSTAVDKLNNEFLNRGTNVKWFGAKGDGVTDDTTSIQNAIDSLSTTGGGTVIVPAGNYMIKAHDSEQAQTRPYYLYDTGGIALKDNVTLKMDNGTTLTAIPNTEHNYNIIRVVGRTNVKILGGHIRGDLDKRTTDQLNGEWGYGIALQGSKNVYIHDVDIQQTMGDAINLQIGIDNSTLNFNVLIDKVYLDKNYRQGISVEGVEHCAIINSDVQGTSGTAPEAGIDLEPGYDTVKNKHILIAGNRIINNSGAGIMASRFVATQDSNSDIVIRDNYFFGNVGKHTNTNGAVIHAYGGNNILVDGNTFEYDGKSALYAIHATTWKDLKFVHNELNDQGVDIKNTKNGVIDGNIININQGYNDILFKTDGNVFGFNIINNTFNALNYVIPRPFDVSQLNRTMTLDGSNINFEGNKLINIAQGIFSVAKSSTIAYNDIQLAYLAGAEIRGANTIFKNNLLTGTNLYGGGDGAIVVRSTAVDGVFENNSYISEPQITIPDAISGYSYPKALIWFDLSDKTNPLNARLKRNHLYNNSNTDLLIYTTNNSGNIDSLIYEGGSVGRGTTIQRPTDVLPGDSYFDTTLSKPIFVKRDRYIGGKVAWVDGMGTDV